MFNNPIDYFRNADISIMILMQKNRYDYKKYMPNFWIFKNNKEDNELNTILGFYYDIIGKKIIPYKETIKRILSSVPQDIAKNVYHFLYQLQRWCWKDHINSKPWH